MKKLIVSMWLTLDGFVAGPNDEMDWLRGDDELASYENNLVANADALVLGRVTYEDFSSYWPNIPTDPKAMKWEVDYAQKVNSMRKVVFSRTLEKAEWNNSSILREVDAKEIEKLKKEPGKDLVIYGSLSIIQLLTNLGLIDEYQLLVHPIILGSGKRLYEHWNKMALKLEETKIFGSGVVLLFYQPDKK
jgi:dihydrofolate reductase